MSIICIVHYYFLLLFPLIFLMSIAFDPQEEVGLKDALIDNRCMLFLCVEDVSQMRLKLQCKTEFLNNRKKIIFCCVYINSGLAGFCIWYFIKRRVQRGVREEDNHIAPSRLGYCLLYIQQERSLGKIYWFDFFLWYFIFGSFGYRKKFI